MNEKSSKDRPLTRSEYIAAMVHFYRGEQSKALAMRIRLDTTTNWAIISVVGVLTFAFASPERSHDAIIIGMLLVSIFLFLEARHYRHYDVSQQRVRAIEINFYKPVLSWEIQGPEQQWGKSMAADLETPQYRVSFLQAVRARLLNNYLAIYLMLLLAWLFKVMIYQGGQEMNGLDRFAVRDIPWYFPLGITGTLYGFFLALIIFVPAIKHGDKNNRH